MAIDTIKKCQDFIGNNKMSNAIDLFETNFTDDESVEFIKLLSTETKQLARSERMGILSFSQINLTRRQLTARFLSHLTFLKNEFASKHSILFLGASPSSLPALNIDTEHYKIKSQLENNEHFILRSWLKTTKKHVLSLTNEFRPLIVHFACHGKTMGLHLESDPPGANNGFFNLSDFKDVIANRSDMIQCLILSACESLELGQHIKTFIPNVIVTNQKVHDKASILFAEGFYQAIDNQNTSTPDYKKAYDTGMEFLKVLNLSDAYTVEFI